MLAGFEDILFFFHLIFPLGKMTKYSVFNNRAQEIFRYSYDASKDLVKFDYSQLHPYALIKALLPGSHYNIAKKKSLANGCKNYKRKCFTEKESKIRLFLLTLSAYKFIEKPKDQNLPIEILCHNGLHNDLILNGGDVYNIILYKGKLIFANTATRKNQNQMLSYIGIRFESILCKQPKPIASSHFKILVEGKYGRWPFKSVVEVDSCKTHDVKQYCEMKLNYIDGITEEKILELKNGDKIGLLNFLKANVKAFRFKLRKWVFQSYFGLQDTLVIGIRDEKYFLVCNFEFNLQKDIIPYMKDTYPSLYEEFINSIDTLDSKYETIYKQVMDLQEAESDVFEIKCSNPLVVKKVATKKFGDIMVPEYLAMVDKDADELRSSKYVDYDSYHMQLLESGVKEMQIDAKI